MQERERAHRAQLQRHGAQRAEHGAARKAPEGHAAQPGRDAERAAEADGEALHNACARGRGDVTQAGMRRGPADVHELAVRTLVHSIGSNALGCRLRMFSRHAPACLLPHPPPYIDLHCCGLQSSSPKL